jgi:hypothetical protein
MKLDNTYRIGYIETHVKAGGVKVENGKAFAELNVTAKIIKWRRLLWRSLALLCDVLDIRLPEMTMKEIKG